MEEVSIIFIGERCVGAGGGGGRSESVIKQVEASCDRVVSHIASVALRPKKLPWLQSMLLRMVYDCVQGRWVDGGGG